MQRERQIEIVKNTGFMGFPISNSLGNSRGFGKITGGLSLLNLGRPLGRVIKVARHDTVIEIHRGFSQEDAKGL